MHCSDAQCGGGFGVALAVVNEEQLLGTDVLAAEHVLVDFTRGFHQFALEADIDRVEVVADGVAVTVEGATFGPFEEEGVGVGEQANAITFLTQATDSIKVALRDLLEVSEPRIETLLVRERFPNEAAEFFDECLCRNQTALQLPEDALLVIGVEEFAGVSDTDFLKTGDGLFVVNLDHHAAHVQCNMCDVVHHYPLIFKVAKVHNF